MKKFITISVLIICLAVSLNAFYVEVERWYGFGDPFIPTNWAAVVSQQIHLRGDMMALLEAQGFDSTEGLHITSVSFDFRRTTNAAFAEIDLYLGHTHVSNSEGNLLPGPFQIVYNGRGSTTRPGQFIIGDDELGWKEIILDTPFVYTPGTNQNILVLKHRTNTTPSNVNRAFRGFRAEGDGRFGRLNFQHNGMWLILTIWVV